MNSKNTKYIDQKTQNNSYLVGDQCTEECRLEEDDLLDTSYLVQCPCVIVGERRWETDDREKWELSCNRKE